ncbi:MAG: DUF1549 domain-containing protein [Armatimonadota bacterium]
MSFEIRNDDPHLRITCLNWRLEPRNEVFLRRACIDITGTMPELDATRHFLASEDPEKRSALIDSLCGNEAFADYWSLKWL